MFEDAIDDGCVVDEGDDAHRARAGGAAQRVNLINLLDIAPDAREAASCKVLQAEGQKARVWRMAVLLFLRPTVYILRSTSSAVDRVGCELGAGLGHGAAGRVRTSASGMCCAGANPGDGRRVVHCVSNSSPRIAPLSEATKPPRVSRARTRSISPGCRVACAARPRRRPGSPSRRPRVPGWDPVPGRGE